MRSKKKILLPILAVLLIISSVSLFAVALDMNAETDSLDVYKCNLSFRSNVCIKYAIATEDQSVKMLVWTAPHATYTYGTQSTILSPVGTDVVDEKNCVIFDYTELAAKQMTDVVYVRAFVEQEDGSIEYGAVKKYSILQYAYNKLGYTDTASTNETLKQMLRDMLVYGASAQQHFSYETDRLATAAFYQVKLTGGTIAQDGSTEGLYLPGETLTLTAPAKDASGREFSHWANGSNKILSELNTYTLTVPEQHDLYTPVYIGYAEGLAYSSNGNGTCTVTGIGACKDTVFKIPTTSPSGDRITAIGANAFQNATNLIKVAIPADVTSLGDGVFNGCETLQSVVFYEEALATNPAARYSTREKSANDEISKLQSIGTDAFSGCKQLVNFKLPATLVTIGDTAFYYCSSLTSVTIPAGVVQIGLGVFGDCELLRDIRVVEGNGYYHVSGGCLIETGSFTLLKGTAATTIPDDGSVRIIAKNSFSSTKGLKNLVVPAPVTRIEERAFSSCPDLTAVYIGNTVETIGANAFRSCKELETVIFEEGGSAPLDIANGYITVDNYGGGGYYAYGVFAHCTSLTHVSLPERMARVASGMFGLCTSLREITLPMGLCEIGEATFFGCEALVEVELLGPNNLFRIESYAFYKASVPDFVIPQNVSVVGPYAFAYTDIQCGDLPAAFDSSLEVFYKTGSNSGTRRPNGTSAFSHCDSLTDAHIPGAVTELPASIYSYCRNLKSVTFDDAGNLQRIGINAFSGCESLESIVLPMGVDVIDNYAFHKCEKLSVVKSPSGLDIIGVSAFAYCKSLPSIEIPGSVGSIGNHAFSYCTALSSVKFEDGFSALVEIGNYAFQNTALTEFTFPTNTVDGVVQEIVLGEMLFKRCTNLTTVTISDSVWNLENVFHGCFSITDFRLSETHEKLAFDEKLPFVVSADRTTVMMVLGELPATCSTLVIPEGYTAIAKNAFSGQEMLKKVVLPTTMADIGSYAFSQCIYLEEIAIAGGDWSASALSAIGNYAFQYTGLKSVTLGAPNLAITVGNFTFRRCHDLTEVKLDGVVSLGNSAFAYCDALVSVEFSDVLTTYGSVLFNFCTALSEVKLSNNAPILTSSMFKGCTALKSIAIPDCVTNIGGNAFSESGLESIDLNKVSILGSLTTTCKPDTATYVFQDCVNLKTVDLGDALTLCAGRIFEGCTALETVIFPNTVTQYGTYMFAGCTSLKSVKFSENATTMQNYMFQNCTALAEIVIPNTVTKYGTYLFSGCTSLKSVRLSENATTMQNYMFQNCTALAEIVIPNTVTKYGSYLFDGCTALKSVTLSENASATVIQSYMFQNCTSLTSITLPDSVITINTRAFDGCGLVSIDLNKTTTLNGSAFANCVNLKSVEASNVTKYGSMTFEGCTALEKYIFSDKTTQYGTYLFSGCTALREVVLSPNAPIIQNYMFKNCTALTSLTLPEGVATVNSNVLAGSGVTSISLPTTLTKIATRALASETLATITLAEGNATFKLLPNGALCNVADSTLVAWPTAGLSEVTLEKLLEHLTIEALSANNGSLYGVRLSGVIDLSESGLTAIPDYMFYGVTGDATLILPRGLTSIGKYAFANCSAFDEIVLPESVTSIGDCAFQNSTVERVSIGGAVETYGQKLFQNADLGIVSFAESTAPVTGLKNMFEGATIDRITIPASLCIYIGGDSSSSALLFKNATVGEVTFAGPIDGSKLTSSTNALFNGATIGTVNLVGWTSIPAYTFYGATLESIVIPASVTEIGTHAFEGSTLKSVTFSNGSVLTTVGNNAFAKCESLVAIELPDSVTTLGTYLFQDCIALESVKLPTGLTELGSYTFDGCTSLKELALPTGLTTIGSGAFRECSSLSSVVLPEGLTKISSFLFKDCVKLSEIAIPSSVTAIDGNAFSGCASLTEMIIPDGVTALSAGLFNGCTLLEKVVLPDSITSISASVFSGCTSLKTLVITQNVVSISGSAFAGMAEDATIYFEFSLIRVANFGETWLEDCRANLVFNYTLPEATPAFKEE